MNTPKKTILIVEDESDLREALAAAFTNDGYLTLTAENGALGLASALRDKPDLILLDVLMPVMDGIEMVKQLREHEEGKKIKVIVMTALDDLEKVAQVIEAGVDEYVMKSTITLSGIVEKVKKKLSA